VDDLGVAPTPVVAWANAAWGYDLGVMVSASHNPEADNGVKPFLAGGRKLTPAEEADVEALAEAASPQAPAAREGPRVDGAARYVEETAALLADGPSLRGLRLVVDVAAGATSRTAPAVMERLGIAPVVLNPEGSRPINDGCGTEHPEAWRKAVRRYQAPAGLAFDGDGDRVLVADAGGEVLDGDDLLSILAADLRARGALPRDTVVSTVMSNGGLEERLVELGARLQRVAVGDRQVAERMRELGAALGGEPSGHVVLPRRAGAADAVLVGDGLVAGLRVLQAAARLGKDLATLRALRLRRPQVLRNVRVEERRPLEAWPEVQRAMREAEALLGGGGRILVRYSGTEPLLRIMAEGRDAFVVDRAVSVIESAATRPARA
jgi:phosphoglucosamine mutase